MQTRPTFRCLRCGHEWRPQAEAPRVCPRCKSYAWQEPRKRAVRHYGVFLFGSDQPDGARYGTGWWEGERGETRPGQPILVEECASRAEARRRADEMNLAEGLPV